MAAKPNFKNFNIINENLTLATLAPEHVCLDKPIAVGCTILDLSKLRMFQFHYEYIKKRYPGGVTEEGVARGDAVLLFTDTDSLAYQVFTENFYQDMCEDRDEQYDTSDFPKDHICHSLKNKKIPGYMKDKMADVPIAEFVGLRPKMYSVLLADGSMKNTAKGIQTHFAKHNMKHELYKRCFAEGRKTVAEYKSIRSFKHKLYTIQERKIGLCGFDNKRYILDGDSGRTYAYGHYKIKK